MNVRIAVAALAAVAVLAVSGRSADAPAAKGDSRIPPGYRAITVPLTGARMAFLKKGDRVDVLATFEAVMKDHTKEKLTATLLQNVVVINLQKPAGLAEEGAVELLVNPNEAQYAALGRRQGELELLIRGDGDTAMKPMEMASFRKLFR